MKTMKYIALGVMAASMTLATTSCSDNFLEVENPSGEPLEEYYTTDEHINEALNAAYDLSTGQIGDWDSIMLLISMPKSWAMTSG